MGVLSDLKDKFAEEVLVDVFDVENPKTQQILGFFPLGLVTGSSIFDAGVDASARPVAGLSNLRFNVSGEIERARLDLFERDRRITDNRRLSDLSGSQLLAPAAETTAKAKTTKPATTLSAGSVTDARSTSIIGDLVMTKAKTNLSDGIFNRGGDII